MLFSLEVIKKRIKENISISNPTDYTENCNIDIKLHLKIKFQSKNIILNRYFNIAFNCISLYYAYQSV